MGHLKTHNIWFKVASLKLSKAKLPLRETKALLFPHLPSAFHLHRARGRAHHGDGTENASSAQQADLGENKGNCVGTSSHVFSLAQAAIGHSHTTSSCRGCFHRAITDFPAGRTMDTGSREVCSSLSVLNFAVCFIPAKSSHSPVGVKPWEKMRWVRTVAQQGVAHTHCTPRALSGLQGQLLSPLLQKMMN